ncbi:membrane protease YdiL (CAAX protease family) [Kibdelosporangium banguiense]|uniref:Membrane protease YdiL (CAAX protease family) n=1 Tax=Kibdelosporangium banguiense TaxID=1365924 RepID=A0ABS4TH50_9PSEU|nr:type II CAAX endopeptidase family protein [Kibdelosporangium banguiense]MBP2323761.1 membrane protease YdiL (CAAX protease family) [Kibdelosporangium banguiense]
MAVEPEAEQPPPPPAHRWGIGAFLLVEAALLLSAVFISAILQPSDSGQPAGVTTILVGSILPVFIATGVALLITRIRGNGPKIDLRWSYSRADFKIGLKFGLIGLVLTTIAAMAWTRIVGEQNATSAFSALVDGHSLPISAAIVMFLYAWLIGPMCEEIIFRGLLWGALERLQWGRWAVFALSTAVFAVSHLEPLRTSLLIVIGIPIGLARLYSGRLGASVVAHQVNNFLPALTVLLISLGVMAP